MRNLISYNQAIVLKKDLEKFINLVDNYEVHSIKSWVVKEYVLTYSIPKVIKNFINDQDNYKNAEIDRKIIIDILNESPADDLHKIAKRMYKKKINKRSRLEEVY